ncbi:MAG: GspE/PulE family protein [Pseudomonadota bacterium]
MDDAAHHCEVGPAQTAFDFLQHLENRGQLNAGDGQRIINLSAQTGEPWDLVVYQLGLAEETTLLPWLSEFTGLRVASNENERAPGHPTINPPFLARHRIIDLTTSSDAPAFGFANPFDQQARSGIAFAIGDHDAYLISADAYNRRARLSASRPTDFELPSDFSTDASRLRDLASSEPIVRRVESLITDASRANASDIHIEPAASSYEVLHRRHGRLGSVEHLSPGEGLAVISRLKILGALDIAERRRPQDGRLTFPVGGRNIDLRISTIPSAYGESVVMRLLDQSAVSLDLETLGFSPEHLVALRTFIQAPHGLVLLTGPTGSGKTTTLYAILSELSQVRRKIMTIEDPIEYRLDGILQSQVNPQIGVNFASALRSFLRHDPDVILVGEIRDKETAEIAMQAALTGHLVLSTLHTNDAPSAVTRLRDLGVEDFLISATVLGVVSQRLLGMICQDCAGAGCLRCAQTGVAGRTAVAELLSVDAKIKSLIRDGASAEQLMAGAASYEPMAKAAARLRTAGRVGEQEIARVLGSDQVAT